MEAIQAIQSIIMKEDDTVMSQDEVLSRILDFYSRYVPFKAYLQQRKDSLMTLESDCRSLPLF